jgi:hypothetical protein
MPFLDNFRLADDPEGTRALASTTITTTFGISDSASLKSRLFFLPQVPVNKAMWIGCGITIICSVVRVG